MHYCILAITEDPEADLAPYQEDDDCNGFWDWYCIGGRWRSSRQLERMFEYIMYLEEKLANKG